MNRKYFFLSSCFFLLFLTTQAYASTEKRWNGFYVGANMGAVRSDVAMQTTAGEGTYFGPDIDVPQIAAATNENLAQWDGIFGGFAGYDYQFNNNIVLGAQANFSSLPVNSSSSSAGHYLTDPNIQFIYDQSTQTNWLGSLRLKLGLAHNSWLLYLTGGGAVTDMEYSSTYNDDNAIPGSGLPGAYGTGSVSKTTYAWIVGAGTEYALTNAWALSAEYLYSNFGTLYATYPITPTPTLEEFGHDLEGKGSLSVQSITLGLSYRF